MILEIPGFLFKHFLKKLIRLYQVILSPFLGSCCRFYPSCSRYGMEVLEKYPVIIALKKIAFRLAKCHPFHPGGEDLP